ncbi:hypothetical protein B0H10DRAFT_1986879 [Mycena sp. CBHHK59/15]|nr:hypothetical protein B0H10DRAFT_1986879 [Mycena sp. CBHHK59/15]
MLRTTSNHTRLGFASIMTAPGDVNLDFSSIYCSLARRLEFTSMKRFPSELEDTIIDFVHSDRPTLASCGLVCRDWVPVSRYHLFSCVSLSRQSAPGFIEIMETSQTTIPLLVRDVQLHFSTVSLPSLVPTLKRLPRTTRLTLHPTRDEVTRTITTSLLSPHFAPLVQLKFDFRSRFESLRQVVDCICLCPQLESLEVGGSWQEMGDFSVAPSFPPSLHTLILTCDIENFLSWLLALDEIPVIPNLVLHHIVQREVTAVAKYLRIAGASLKSLALIFRDHDAPGVCAHLHHYCR